MAKKTFGVALWNRPTHAKQHQDTAGRLKLLGEALQAAQDLTNKHLPDTSDTRTIGSRPASFDNILVAPEYMFAKHVQGATGQWAYHLVRGQENAVDYSDQRFMREGKKDILLAALQTLSGKKFRRTLLVPGTVAWQKPILRAKDKLNKQPRDVKAIQRLYDQTSREMQRSKKLGYLPDGWTYDTVFCHQWNDITDKQGTLLLRPYSNLWKEAALQTTATHVARNTAYALLSGDFKLKYHKQRDYLEVLNNSGKTMFIPGVSNGTFEVDHIGFGMEICADHGSLCALHAGRLPHIQIVSSSTVDLDPNFAHTKQDGYVLHADTLYDRTEVVQVNGWRVLDPVEEVYLDHDPLKFYVLTVDV
jgi:hypothetical protein